MKKHDRSLMVMAALALSAGCNGTTPTESDPGIPLEPVRPFSTVEQQVSASNTGFGLELLREIHAQEGKPNVLVSPLSASMALGMTMNGAVGDTHDAMKRVLGFGGLDEPAVNQAYRGLIAQLRARDPKVEMGLANAIWYREGFAVKQPFIDTVRTYFGAEVASLDFSSPAAPGTISAWAERQTGGRIKNLVREISPLERMFLVNAVYFKAPWTTPFNPDATRDGPFTRLDGSVVQAPLMSVDASFPHLADEQVQMVELPYADSAFSMVLLAPAAGASLDALVAGLTPQRWADLTGRLRSSRVMLTIPKYRLEYEIQMKPALSAMGMGIAFEPRGGFTRIADLHDLHITRVQQKAFIDVHELGTEAAAATAVGVGIVSMPPQLRFDRPFVFAIRERTSGTILFIGRVGDPVAG